jgi:uncharacterized membrane protein YkgB
MLRWVLLAFVAQMVGTVLVFIVRPEVAFQHGNPLRLTVEGEFVIKNLVLLAAGLVVGASINPRSPRGLSEPIPPAAGSATPAR